MLTDNEKLYEALGDALRAFYQNTVYYFVHAIYETGDDDEGYEGLYHAAVDLFSEGETYHIYFAVSDDGGISIDTVERWFMG
jgi:hypothetical protein